MNIRKVALTIATASSVALAGTAAASAQDAPMSDNNAIGSITNEDTTPAGSDKAAGSEQEDTTPTGSDKPAGSVQDEAPETGEAKGSDLLWRIGNALGADQALNADQIFGSDVKPDAAPWGPLLHVALIAGVIGSIASVIIGIGNYLKHEGIIR
ncbi:hypothetical protein [Corynebacterium auriscanis]|uniref:hypothetical protein n=1 Tax=Corynebacterium auriscanis TaxID=99807 RepID=UPI0022470200|nr:hypothetical protein [Corynebacterium auriscanis]MCX2163877.1 hypothetical protein [Corynebacterium auriscanis]